MDLPLERDQTIVDVSAADDELGVADWPTDFVRENALPLRAFAEGNLSWRTGSLSAPCDDFEHSAQRRMQSKKQK